MALSISFTNSKEIRATATSSLVLLLGTAYSLIITSANGTEVTVPITIEVPNGYVSPAMISGANAVSGNVLKWNGTAWVPSTDYVGAPTSSGLLFMGFTDPNNGNLGGFKGANEKCHQAYPGSHWADVEEIMKLGHEYPWTYAVWVRRGYYEGNNSNPTGSGVDQLSTREMDCYDWTALTSSGGTPILGGHTQGGSILMEYGRPARASCASLHRLACVK